MTFTVSCMRRSTLPYFVILVALNASCAIAAPVERHKNPLPVVAQPQPPEDPPARVGAANFVIHHATIMTAADGIFNPGYVAFANGRITALGQGDAPADPNAIWVDGTGTFVTPGVIDVHSHMGVYPMPDVPAHEDGNELTKPTTPEIWAEHGFWPQDPSLWRALAQGGVTTIQVLPGSGNLIGGRSYVAKMRPDTSARLMRFRGAPQGLKMACGENPKRVYGSKGQAPMTRMGNIHGFRAAFQEATEYRRRWQKYERDLAEWREEHDDDSDSVKNAGDDDDDPPEAPERSLGLETLALVLDGKILVHNHCYRADELHIMLDVAHEFGFKIRAFHHGLEAYKLRHRLAEEGVGVATWADWWGFKMEAFDGIAQNAAMLSEAGVKTMIHSDSELDVRHLNQEVGKAVASGKKIGINISDNDALRWITANPAWALGVDAQTGTLEVGKMADVVVWDHHPFSVYARPVRVFIDGESVYDRSIGARLSDFELGLFGDEGMRP